MTTDQEMMSGKPFEIFERREREGGIREHILVLPSVICAREVASEIATRANEAVCAPHDHGCGQVGADNDQTERTLVGVGTNPNVAGAVVVGLGCEHIGSDRLETALAANDVPVTEVAIQSAGGTAECVREGVDAVRERTASRGERRQSATLADLTVGVVATDLHTSTLAVSETVGAVVDRVVAAGGRTLVAGAEVARHDPAAAIERASDDAADGVAALASSDWSPAARTSAVSRGLSDVGFDDATGVWGSQCVREVVDYGARATLDEGLALVDAPARFAEAATALAAAGAHLVVHLTGDGVPSGHPVVPVLKLSGNKETVAALPDAIDANAAAAEPAELMEHIRQIATGAETAAERHALAPFAISRVGPSM